MKLDFIRLFYADNTTLNGGTGGDVIGSDDIGGVKFQRIKVIHGIDGVNNGDVATTNPLPVQIGDTSTQVSVFPGGFERVTDEPKALLNENYDSLDTANTWNISSGGGGVVPAISSGVLSIATTTTAGAYSILQSQYQFKIPAPGWKVIAQAVAFADAAAPIANAYRFWGEGVKTGTPTAVAPLTDAVGFELGTDGKLRAVVYNSGTRTVVQDLSAATGSAKQPTDTGYHLYIIYIRTHRVYFYIDGISATNLVATGVFTYPAQQALPVMNFAVAGTTPASSATFTILGSSVSDTTKQASTIADPDFPWRRAKVSSAGELVTKIKRNPADVDQLSLEGGHLDASVTSTTGTRTGKVTYGQVFVSSAVLNLAAVGSGRVAWVEEIVISNMGTIPFLAGGWLLESGLGATFNGPLGETWNEIVPAGGRAVITLNRFIQEGTTFNYGFTALQAGLQPHWAIRSAGISFTDDLNFNAKSRICLVETSLGYNQMGNDPNGVAYRNKMGYAAQMIAQINLDGKSARLINKAVTNTDTSHWLTLLSSGYLRGFDYELLIVSLGINDAITGSGITTTQFKANLKEFAYERDRYMPAASIIFVAPPVTDSTTRTTNIASFRTAVSEVVTELIAAGEKRVYFHDFSTNSFTLNATPASDTNFTLAERSAGNRVHPSGAGNTLLAFGATGLASANAGLYGVVKTTDYYKNLA